MFDIGPTYHIKKQCTLWRYSVTLTETDLNAMSTCIAEMIHPERIILFGSHARGEATQDSDVDLLVIVPEGFAKQERWQKLQAIRKATACFRCSKDILLYSHSEVEQWKNSLNHVVANALREGRLLYERP